MNKFKAGDRVKVKPLREIKKTLDKENHHKVNGLYFNDEARFHSMADYCDDEKIYTIKGSALRGYKLDDEQVWTWHEDWLEYANDIKISIDPSNPKAAHAAVSKACKEWKDKQRDWTEAEIEEAKKLSDEVILELYHGFNYPVFYFYPETKSCRLVYGGYGGFGTHIDYSDTEKQVRVTLHNSREYFSKAVGKDIYNPYIAMCVCLCKATGRKIPKFIRDKNN